MSGFHLTSPRFWTQKNTTEPNYITLLDKHKEPFKSIAKTTTGASLLTISSSIEYFQDVIKALPQST